MALPSMALPGQFLGHTDNYLPGPGTHIHDSQIYASIGGPVISSTPSSTHSTSPQPPPLLSISRPSTSAPTSSSNSNNNNNNSSSTTLLPTLSSIVLCRITRLTTRTATCTIHSIDNTVCRTPFTAQIRREDVRATEKDKIRLEDCFRVGDLVRAAVISLGDQSGYYVATERNELGVVLARSAEGRVMCPVSWREFVDPVSGVRELRKVAKPF